MLVGANIRVNQAGYVTGATKVAVVVNSSPTPVAFKVVPSASACTAATPPGISGNTVVFGADAPSGDSVHKADFSSLTTAGTYKVCVGADESYPFEIGSAPYAN